MINPIAYRFYFDEYKFNMSEAKFRHITSEIKFFDQFGGEIDINTLDVNEQLFCEEFSIYWVEVVKFGPIITGIEMKEMPEIHDGIYIRL